MNSRSSHKSSAGCTTESWMWIIAHCSVAAPNDHFCFFRKQLQSSWMLDFIRYEELLHFGSRLFYLRSHNFINETSRRFKKQKQKWNVKLFLIICCTTHATQWNDDENEMDSFRVYMCFCDKIWLPLSSSTKHVPFVTLCTTVFTWQRSEWFIVATKQR